MIRVAVKIIFVLCVAKDLVYNFDDGTIYKYEVDGLSVTQLPGSSSDVSKLSITATAEISAQAQCSYVLKLSNVQVSGADGKVGHLKGITKLSLRSHPFLFYFINDKYKNLRKCINMIYFQYIK